MRAVALALALLAASPAAAHEVAGGGGPADDTRIALGLSFALAAVYGRGVLRLWGRAGRGRGVPVWRAGCFLVGVVLLVAAYGSPLHALGGRLFVAHVVEHELLIVVVAPLLALGRPFAPMLWGLPRGWRRPVGAALRHPALTLWGRSGPATLLHAAAVWAWHAPAAYGGALSDPVFHWLQHASLFGTALLFWHAMLGRGGRARQGSALFALFVTALHTAFLGILLTAARSPLYPGQSGAAGPGVSPCWKTSGWRES